MKKIIVCLMVILFVIPPLVNAEGITEKQADAILNELKQIRVLLQKQQALLKQRPGRAPRWDQNVSLPLRDTYAIGSKDAPVTLVEFTDYQCPFCSRFHKNTFPQLKKNFVDTGKVRFISRDLPLPFHKHAFKAARASRCAGEQGKYWEARDLLGSNPKNLSDQAISDYARELNLDTDQFQTCLASKKYETEIKQDISEANQAGITGTPGFVLGKTPKDGTMKGVKISGAQPYTSFAAQINKLLAAKKQPAASAKKQ
jgi:protein-disulfide isomerase